MKITQIPRESDTRTQDDSYGSIFCDGPLVSEFQTEQFNFEEIVLRAQISELGGQINISNGGNFGNPLLLTLRESFEDETEPHAWIENEEALARIPQRFRLEGVAHYGSVHQSSGSEKESDKVSVHKAVIPNESWIEARNEKMDIRYSDEFGAFLMPARFLAPLALSYAILPLGMVCISKKIEEDRNYVPRSIFQIDLFFGEERNGELDLAWSESYYLLEDKLRNFIEREATKCSADA